MAQEQIAKLDTDISAEEKVDVEVDPNTHDAWKSSWGDSFQIQNFFDHDELEWLTDLMYRRHHKRRVKESGTLHFWVDNEAVETKFYDKLKEVIPELEDTHQWEGNYVMTGSPYNLHIDTGRPDWVMKKGLVPGKQIIIPLFVGHINKEFKGTDNLPGCGTAVFNNRFIKYGTNFAKSDNKYDTDVFYTVRNYDNLTCYNKDGSVKDVNWNTPIDDDIYKKYFTHYKKSWLDGFELENVYQWDRGSLIVFDRSQAHSGINFMANQVTIKCGLTLMTTRRL